MQDTLSIRTRRSPLGRVRGAGTAKSGVHHWYAERVTSLALVPLTLWFIFSTVRLAGARQEFVAAWAGHPWNAVLLLALIVMTFHHMALGIQVVLEDYVKPAWVMTTGVLVTKAVCGLLALTAALSVLKLALQ